MKRAKLNEKSTLNQLEELVNNLGIELRYEKIKKESSFFPGGLCTISGKKLLIINSQASMEDKIQIFIRAVKDFDIDDVFVKPALREMLTEYKE